MSWEFTTGRFGQTAGQSIDLPEGKSTIVFAASGNEIRLVLCHNNDETRGKVDQVVLCLVLGQDRNTCSRLGVGNPFLSSSITTRHRFALCSGDLGQERIFWLSFDTTTGWAAFGDGPTPMYNSIQLCAKLVPPGSCWTRFAFSNWEAPAKVRVLDLLGPIQLHRPKKFDKFCRLERYVGITAICNLDPSSHLYQLLLRIQHMLMTSPVLAPHFALLPPSSFHMTVFDIKSGQENQDDLIFEAQAATAECFEHAKDLKWTLKPQSIHPEGVLINLAPVTQQDAESLRNWREAVASKLSHLGVRANPNYGFHSTLAYAVYPLASDEAQMALHSVLTMANQLIAQAPVEEIGFPQLCNFQDMGRFVPFFESGEK